MNNSDTFPVLLLTLFVATLGVGSGITLLVRRWLRARPASGENPHATGLARTALGVFPLASARPASWLAARGRNLHAVQSALGLHHVRPCTWIEGLTDHQKLFIAPPVNGWILVAGSGLPEPGEDIDACFRFVLELSRKLGHVQFFHANPVLDHHAWVRAESGRIVRAYAWAGQTLWNQGARTPAELELGLKCFHYFETPESAWNGRSDVLSSNTEKVPLLAARWSFDPAAIDERTFERASGLAGEPPRLY